MNISDIILKMVSDSNGNRHDINHFLKVSGGRGRDSCPRVFEGCEFAVLFFSL